MAKRPEKMLNSGAKLNQDLGRRKTSEMRFGKGQPKDMSVEKRDSKHVRGQQMINRLQGQRNKIMDKWKKEKHLSLRDKDIARSIIDSPMMGPEDTKGLRRILQMKE